MHLRLARTVASEFKKPWQTRTGCRCPGAAASASRRAPINHMVYVLGFRLADAHQLSPPRHSSQRLPSSARTF